MSIPVYLMDERRAIDSFNVHCALIKAEKVNPALRENPQWTVIRQDAYEAFYNAFARAP